jgi:hypothetical protein
MDSEQFAWREIVARVFEGFKAERDVTPAWLTSTQTGRPLKLNYYYPEIKVAVRLEGLRGRDQRVGPDELERHQQSERESERERLCEAQGVRLLAFDVYAEPQDTLRAIQAALAWAMRQAAKSESEGEDKLRLLEQMRQARTRFDEIRGRVRTDRDLQAWAELWVDRAYEETRSAPRQPARGPVPRYVLNMHVRHADFGTGNITGLADEDGEQIVTVRFDSGEERQFLAQLVTERLRPC